MSVYRVMGMFVGLVLACSAQAAEPVVTNGVAKLDDTPAIQFETSGWDYANTANPVLLTPDTFTNALLGISRLKPGQPLLDGGPVIPATLNPQTIQAVLAKRLKNKPGLSIRTESVGKRQLVVAMYNEGDRKGIEYAFEMRGYLIHVLLIAKRGHSFDAGALAARKVVDTMKPL